jgi:hypothetical protein
MFPEADAISNIVSYSVKIVFSWLREGAFPLGQLAAAH